jgi:hypothetical protein
MRSRYTLVVDVQGVPSE